VILLIKITRILKCIMAVYDIKDSASMCKCWKACVNTGKHVQAPVYAGGYTRIMAFVCLIFGQNTDKKDIGSY